ncbi:MAG TPA: hypothetical protein VFW71_16180 [Actinomycetota bacterium]|nr:hypothetical protein [Actinomycetota bacterium]
MKATVLLGFTLAAHNLDPLRSFKAKRCLDDDGAVIDKSKWPPTRRRSGTRAENIEGSSKAPPPTWCRLRTDSTQKPTLPKIGFVVPETSEG